jgi:hypothetical protein
MSLLFTWSTALIGFAMFTVQPAVAFDDNPWGKPVREKPQAKQRGKENLETKPWEVRPWESKQSEVRPPQAKPWESSPWASASEELRPKEARPGEEVKATENKRRVGRKARKERNEKSQENAKSPENTERLSSHQDRAKQRQERWRRLQMQSELYNSPGVMK